MSGLSVGIDLGTTNSLITIYGDDGDIELVPLASGDVLLPSAVSITEQGTTIVGAGAKSRLVQDPSKAVAAFKRAIGTEKEFTLGRIKLTATELSSLVLKEMVDSVAAKYDQPIEQLVITVPAYFNSVQREATLAAADLAGLKVSRLINEPTAAALAYGLQDKEAESTFVVLDLGGGTFDVSILEMFDGVMEVRSSSGDAFLGGEDFTASIVQDLVRQLGGVLDDLSPEQRGKLYFTAERMKQALSEQHETRAEIEFEGANKEGVLTRTSFEELCVNLVARMRKPIERCLYDANIGVEEVDRVLLVGGATRMPIVRSMASKLFKKLPERGLDPDHVVAMGAAVQAGLCAKNEALEDVVMTDVAPFSLGIMSRNETAHGAIEGAFVPIIERNTTIPASRSQYFSTLQNDQRIISIRVYQGEAPLAQDNMKLGQVEAGVPPSPAGQETVEVRFSYDVNGLLEVDVTSMTTKVTQSIVIEGGAKTLSPADRNASLSRLKKLKMHPKEQSENQELIEKLNELFVMHLGEDRQFVSGLLAQFMSALDTQDPSKIEKARAQVKAQCEALSGNYVK